MGARFARRRGSIRFDGREPSSGSGKRRANWPRKIRRAEGVGGNKRLGNGSVGGLAGGREWIHGAEVGSGAPTGAGRSAERRESAAKSGSATGEAGARG